MKGNLLLIVLAGSSVALATPELTRTEYISKYRETAIQHQLEYHIPASITIAQAILESASGNSVLAQKANNHFGIKCSNDWKGESYYKSDDKENDCFRVYKSVEESYKDHSEILATRTRYSNLFSLSSNDYKGWAKGLKSAGYATASNYDQQLIQLIEDLKLYEMDQTMSAPISSALNYLEHANKVKFITAKKGDTFYRIAKNYGLTLWQLHQYNDFDSEKDVLQAGDIVYLEPKRLWSHVHNYIVLDKAMTPREIAQKEAVKLKTILRRNFISSPDEQLPVGEKIFLR
ncbi:MAG: hypothetical protein RL264_2943 [Bacteroidota bacterium]|jgi:LysM repeat protein